VTAIRDREPDFPHLPAGRTPGPQSLRNRRRRNLLAPFVGLVGLAMYAAGVWVAAGGRGPRFDRREELLGGLVFAAGGLLCVVGAFAIAERGRPNRSARLRGVTLQVAGEAFRRGDAVSVTLNGRGSSGGRLEVGIACDERFEQEVPDAPARTMMETIAHEDWQAVPDSMREHTLDFTLPDDAPYSYEGDAVSFAWRVSVRVARLGRDARYDHPIWVDP
jgi:hypothetical protein